MMDKDTQAKLREAGFSLDPLLDALEDKAGDLAAQWRATKTDKLVRQYHAVLRCLIELDWEGFLDVDAELPDRLMPPEYFEYLKQRHPVQESSPESK